MRFTHLIIALGLLHLMLAGFRPMPLAVAQEAGPILLPSENTPDPIVTNHHLDIENYENDGPIKIRREINLLSDNSLVNHGQFQEFYKNGQLFAEGQYKDGVQDGAWEYWHENGTKCKSVRFANGVPVGEWTVYGEDGKQRATRNYVHGKPQGTWRTYTEDGEVVLEERQFDEGLAHGTWIKRFASGQTQIEESYERGKRHGKYLEHNEQGQLVREMEFKDGRLDGKVLIRTADGQNMVQQYRDGKLVLDSANNGSN